jgi:hypothetical protein
MIWGILIPLILLATACRALLQSQIKAASQPLLDTKVMANEAASRRWSDLNALYKAHQFGTESLTREELGRQLNGGRSFQPLNPENDHARYLWTDGSSGIMVELDFDGQNRWIGYRPHRTLPLSPSLFEIVSIVSKPLRLVFSSFLWPILWAALAVAFAVVGTEYRSAMAEFVLAAAIGCIASFFLGPLNDRSAPDAEVTFALLSAPLVIVVSFLEVAIAFASVRRIRLITDVEQPCLKCGYNLTGNVSGVCPECGTEIPKQLYFRLRNESQSSST